MSVIGGVSFYGNTQAEDVENLLVQVRIDVFNHGQQRHSASCLCRLNWALPFLLEGDYLFALFLPTWTLAWTHTNSLLTHNLLPNLLFSWSLSSQHRLATCLRSLRPEPGNHSLHGFI